MRIFIATLGTETNTDQFLKQGVILRYMYADRERRHIATIDIAPADCGF